MRQICVMGTGYVGLTTGTCFADLGNQVTCVDVDAAKVAALHQGKLPIYEPGLAELVGRNVQAGRLRFTTDASPAIGQADFVFIAVGTPSMAGGDDADLQYVQAAAQTIAQALSGHTIIVNKSTVPIGTGDWVAGIVGRHAPAEATFAVVSNPEFLREGSAVLDFMGPDRVVLGSTDRFAAEQVAGLYLTLRCPIIITDLRTAEMIKYASNSFLATRISFINEIAQICERMGADVKEVANGMGMDKRIGRAFLDAGLGYGGSCFPKDVKALARMAERSGCHPQLLHSVMEINRDQRRVVVDKVRAALGDLRGSRVGLLGLAFKPNTDDMREAPSVDIAAALQAEGATVVAYDPVAHEAAERVLHDVAYAADPYAVAVGADALIVVTEWNEFKNLDMDRLRSVMRRPILIDGRNIYEPDAMLAAGFQYRGMGRGVPPTATGVMAVDEEPGALVPAAERTLP